MISKRVTWTEHGDPVVTIRIVGYHDAFRFACHLVRGQCEFADVGRRTLRSLRRRNRRGFDHLNDSMHDEATRSRVRGYAS